eukprot:3588972-Amphidinium_carterae.1
MPLKLPTQIIQSQTPAVGSIIKLRPLSSIVKVQAEGQQRYGRYFDIYEWVAGAMVVWSGCGLCRRLRGLLHSARGNGVRACCALKHVSSATLIVDGVTTFVALLKK